MYDFMPITWPVVKRFRFRSNRLNTPMVMQRRDLVVAGMPEQTGTDDDVAFESQALLCFVELILEAGASAEGDYFVVADHTISDSLFGI